MNTNNRQIYQTGFFCKKFIMKEFNDKRNSSVSLYISWSKSDIIQMHIVKLNIISATREILTSLFLMLSSGLGFHSCPWLCSLQLTTLRVPNTHPTSQPHVELPPLRPHSWAPWGVLGITEFSHLVLRTEIYDPNKDFNSKMRVNCSEELSLKCCPEIPYSPSHLSWGKIKAHMSQ